MTTVQPPPPDPCAYCSASITGCRAKHTNGGTRCCLNCTHDATDLGATSESQ